MRQTLSVGQAAFVLTSAQESRQVEQGQATRVLRARLAPGSARATAFVRPGRRRNFVHWELMNAMEARYVAYGLELRSAFRLPGMTPNGDGGLPWLALELVTDAELDTVWSGSDMAPVWRGRLGDGSELAIGRGVTGDLLFANDERARFRLDPSGRSLLCAPRQVGLDWQRTLLTKVLFEHQRHARI